MDHRLFYITCFLFPIFVFGQRPVPATGASPLSQVPVLELPAQDNAALRAEELARRAPGRAPRFAQRLEVDIRPETSGQWETLPNGNWLWRLRVRSADAYSLNLGFTEFYMPPGGQLLLYDPLQQDVLGPFSAEDNEHHQQLWTPVLGGGQIVLEVELPPSQRPYLRLWLTSVNHDFLNFYGVTTGACHLDVLCGANDGWGIVDQYEDVIQSVAVYGTGGETFCTGALINTTANDCRPYFLSAFHCDVTPSEAPSVVVYWNYRNSYCRQPGTVASSNPGNGSLNNFNTGAVYRAGYQPTDFVLFELDDPIPSSSQAFFAGWSREASPPEDTVVCVHHPDGAEKRISFAFTDTYAGAWGNGNQEVPNGDHLIVPDWSVGSTEVGSSGAPLFNKQGRIVGQLHGGGASCSNNEYDAFGWIRSSWEGGGSPTTRLKDWLAPGGDNLFFLDGQWLSSCNAAIFITPAEPAICVPGTVDFDIEIAEAFSGPVEITVAGLPPGVEYTVNPATPYGGSTATLTLDVYGTGLNSGALSFSVTASDALNAVTEQASVGLVTDAPPMPDPLWPIADSEGISLAPTFSWTAEPEATGYDIQVAEDTSFTNLLASLSNLGNPAYQGVLLEPYATYYFRVRARNLCGLGEWSEPVRFRTSAISCTGFAAADVPAQIPSSGPNSISSALQLDLDGAVASVAIRHLDIEHTYVGDLSAILRSPDGTVVQLFDRPGFPLIPFGCSGDDLLLDFSDNALASPYDLEATCGDSPAIAGTFRPGTPLSELTGETAAGEWQLIVFDNFSQDGGQLKNWALDICTTYPPKAEVFTGSDNIEACIGHETTVELFIGAGYQGPVTLGLVGLPAGAVASFSPELADPGTFVTLTIDNLSAVGDTDLILYGGDGESTHFCELTLQVTASPAAPLLLQPDDASPVFQGAQTFSWTPSVGATAFQLDISQDSTFQTTVVSTMLETPYLNLPTELEAGLYYWRVVAMNRCGSTYSNTYSFFKEGAVTATTAVAGRSPLIFPNPTGGQLTVQLPQAWGHTQATLYHPQGQQLLRQQLVNAGMLDLGYLPAGVYYLQLQSSNYNYTSKIVRQ